MNARTYTRRTANCYAGIRRRRSLSWDAASRACAASRLSRFHKGELFSQRTRAVTMGDCKVLSIERSSLKWNNIQFDLESHGAPDAARRMLSEPEAVSLSPTSRRNRRILSARKARGEIKGESGNEKLILFIMSTLNINYGTRAQSLLRLTDSVFIELKP